MSEYQDFVDRFPHISFGYNPSKADKNHYLFAVECHVISESNYDPNIINQYKGFISWNPEYLKHPLINVPTYLAHGFPFFDNKYRLTPNMFVPFEEKLDGISCICRHRDHSGRVDDITHLRLETMENLPLPVRHTYGKIPYGGSMYQGVIGNSPTETYPSSLQKLKTMAKYKFNLALENAYGIFNYKTEKPVDSFAAATVPLYLGASNSRTLMLPESFIDLEPYVSYTNSGLLTLDYPAISKYLNSITKEQYEKMVDAGQYYLDKARWGNTDDLAVLLESLK